MIDSQYNLAVDSNSPLDILQDLSKTREWVTQRENENLLIILLKNDHSRYKIFLEWQEEFQSLQISCLIDLTLDESHIPAASQLVVEINDNLWLGHFNLTNLQPVFTYTMMLQSIPDTMSSNMVLDILDIALSECDRFYLTFELLVQGDIRTRDVLSAAIFETIGEA